MLNTKIVSLFQTPRGTWNWFAGVLADEPSYSGGGCDTPEQALKEAMWALGHVSCLQEPKGHG